MAAFLIFLAFILCNVGEWKGIVILKHDVIYIVVVYWRRGKVSLKEDLLNNFTFDGFLSERTPLEVSVN